MKNYGITLIGGNYATSGRQNINSCQDYISMEILISGILGNQLKILVRQKPFQKVSEFCQVDKNKNIRLMRGNFVEFDML